MSPLFFKDEDLAECTENARLFFLGLTTQADREGRLEDRPLRLKGEIFPYHNIDVEALLEELSAPRQWSPGTFITRYEVGGRRFIQINNFLKYQHPHPNESASVIPPSSNIRSASDIGVSAQALPSFPSEPSVPSGSSEPSGSSGVPPSPASDEFDPHEFTQELVAEVQEHAPDSGVSMHPALSMAVSNLLTAGHPKGLACANGRLPLAREDIVDAVHGWILAERGDPWHLDQRARGTPFTLSRLLTQAVDRLPDYAEKGRAGWGREHGVHGLEHPRAQPIEAPVDPEITARHQAREAERLERVKAWREEKPPAGMPPRQARQWAEEHKRRRP